MVTRIRRIATLASMVLMLLFCEGCSNGTGSSVSATTNSINGVSASPELVGEMQAAIAANVSADPQYKLSNDEIDELKSQNLVSEADAATLELYIVQ